jgi:hypothetical protein
MADQPPETRPTITGLILVPALITLGITVLRLVGELQHWPKLLFNNAPGGGAAIIGISWLPFIFGPYFAIKLARSGERPASAGKTIGLALAGFVLMGAGGIVAFSPIANFPGKFVLGLLLIVAGGALQFPGWPKLAKVLIGYAYAARIPVALVMFFAMRRNWGTHYDAVAPGYTGPLDLWGKYAFLGLAPQLLMWIVYTMCVGALCGGIAAVIVKGRRTQPLSAS